MGDYEDRRQPIDKLCPQCLSLTPIRESILMRQHMGGRDWRITCSDFSICNYVENVKVLMIDGTWIFLEEAGEE